MSSTNRPVIPLIGWPRDQAGGLPSPQRAHDVWIGVGRHFESAPHRACRFRPRDEDRRRIVVEHLLQLGDGGPRLVVAVGHAQPIERPVGSV